MIRLEHISKDYLVGNSQVHALKDIDLSIGGGDFIAITGPSGAGKSTLMSILGCLDTPTRGKYLFNNKAVSFDHDDALAELRGQYFGFVFQSFNLIPRLTIVRNIELPMIYAGVPEKIRLKRTRAVLKAVDLAEMEDRRPSQLSGGQQQRVAIARALVNNPPVIIADEPTGNLDADMANEILELFNLLNQGGKTIIYVTHDKSLLKHATRIVHVEDGHIKEL